MVEWGIAALILFGGVLVVDRIIGRIGRWLTDR
jgi:hypothetical protein